MPEWPHYTKAPITEAAIEIRVADDEGYLVPELEAIATMLGPQYQFRQKMLSASATVEFKAGELPEAQGHQRHIGFSFQSLDPKTIIQAKVDGLVVSRLAPYDQWSTLRDEARRVWDLYKDLRRPKGITRVGLRYINRLEIPIEAPGAIVRIEDYFRLYPELPISTEGFKHTTMSGFFIQTQIPQPDLAAMLIVNESQAIDGSPTVLPIILDLDLFSLRTFDIGDEEGLWRFIEQFRDRKNQVFEGVITDATRELIK